MTHTLPDPDRTRLGEPPSTTGTGVPVTVWLAPASAVPQPDSGLPNWAAERLRTLAAPALGHSGDALPTLVWRPGTAPGRALPDPGGPGSLVVADLSGTGTPPPPAPVRRRVHAYGLAATTTAVARQARDHQAAVLALAVRQRRTHAGQLADGCGPVVTAARAMGWRYVQHIVVVHAHLDGAHLVPHESNDGREPAAGTSPSGPRPLHHVIHNDLLLFTAADHP